ncbi:MAG: malonyl-CoA decarboxylase [Phyllobacteriaceae bacterium]|jgi:malonyl-CoA decarboxylase|nr:malonyl-CoA decarboxylase [Phyllobacteriaceae bacterium]
MTTLNAMLQSIIDRGTRLIESRSGDGFADQSLSALLKALLQSRGEASGMALAAHILDRFDGLDAEGRLAFFTVLARECDVDAERARAALEALAADDTPPNLKNLIACVEPDRQEIFRLLNLAPGGTERLVRMRAHLLTMTRDHPDLKRVDNDLRHLLRSWFNRGFLVLRPIDWFTPANILEKIIDYEAVHEIGDWDQLRLRLEPDDRKCFAFFHPAMHNEPLVFVEVALATQRPASIQDILRKDRDVLSPDAARTAVFYSISNCQRGLREISFGAFLIKQVVAELRRDVPHLNEFVTLSPMPGFVRWLRESGDPAEAFLAEPDWQDKTDAKPMLLDAAFRYLVQAKRDDGFPLDPVARFHLRNGAELKAINWRGDISENGLAKAAGLMVNYLYDPGRIEGNHEAYVRNKKVAVSRQVRSLVRTQSQARGEGVGRSQHIV